MRKKKDYIAVISMILLFVTAVAGVSSLDFSHSYKVTNQYGHIVSMYGYGIYAHDSYFKAPIFIGTDVCILVVLLPLFVYSYVRFRRENDRTAELRLLSVYAVALYYAASLVFCVAYNRLFLVYVMLFSLTLFGLFLHIGNVSCQKTAGITKGLKVFLCLSGISLMAAWFPDIIPTIINGTPLSLIEVYTTEATYVFDIGIISPLCFVCSSLLKKEHPLGTVLLAVLLKACMVVGIMMIPQMICQVLSGVEMPLPVLLTKSISFIILGGFAWYFNKKMYKELRA